MASLLLLAFLFKRIHPATRNRTIHGYLGSVYGTRVQWLGAVATSIGYIVNTGFELFWAALMFTGIIGRSDLTLTVALLLAAVTGLYCSIGGFYSNAETDKPQNWLGVAALASLVFLTAQQVQADTALTTVVWLFAVGSIAYLMVISLNSRIAILRTESFQNWLAILFALSACVAAVMLFLLGGTDETVNSHRNLLQNLPLPTPLIVGLLSFQIIFNAIDMANWQQIAANGDEPRETQKKIQWSIVRGSLYLFWFPALGGTLLGCLLRAIDGNIPQIDVFSAVFNLVRPDGHGVVRGLILGFLTLGFLSTSLSTADSMLMSAAQTISYDLIWIRRLRRVIESKHEKLERAFVLDARALLIPLAGIMVLTFWVLFKVYPDDVLNFQPMMYSWALSLFAPAILALFQTRENASRGANWILGGMALTLLTVAGMFVAAVSAGFESYKDWLLNLMPVVSNGLMIVATIFGRLFGRARPTAEPANVR